MLMLKKNGVYTDKPTLDNQVTTKCLPSDNQMETEVSIGKVSIGKDNNIPPAKTKKRFVKPTLEEVEAYIKEKGYNIDAEHFIDYYESKGWTVGKNPMKDWKAAVRNWSRNNFAKPKTKAHNFSERTDNDWEDIESALLNK